MNILKQFFVASIFILSIGSASVWAQEISPAVVAVVNIEKVERGSVAWKSLSTQINEQRIVFKNEVTALQNNLKAKSEELETQRAILSAEAFAQKIAGDYTTDMNFVIAEAPKAASPTPAPEEVTMVGSDKYAAKFCQTEFNALLKQQKIVFESGSSKLQEASSSLLDKISQVAVRCPNQIIQVHGYTDSRGGASANWKLSKVRAEAVASYLSSKGIEKSRLTAIGHGEKRPIASNKTEKGRAQNRRITLIVRGNKK